MRHAGYLHSPTVRPAVFGECRKRQDHAGSGKDPATAVRNGKGAEVEQLLVSKQRRLVGHPRYLDRGCRVQVVAIIILPPVKVDYRGECDQYKQPKPSIK